MNVDHIRNKSESFKLELRDVCLQEDIDLGGWLFNGFLDRYRYTLKQLAQLKFLLYQND